MSDNKTDKDLKSQIKMMEAEKRAKIMSSNEIKFIQPDGDSSKISYDQWWMLASKKIAFRPWMKEVIFADFKGRGLTKTETQDRYNEAIRLFGYQI
jgi:hypothetical protein